MKKEQLITILETLDIDNIIGFNFEYLNIYSEKQTLEYTAYTGE